MSIKDPNYYLPKVHALNPIEIFSTGANRPVLMDCVSVDGKDSGLYVVKLKAGERMCEESFMKELLACFMAMEMGLNTMEPAVVEIPTELVESQKGNSFYNLLRGSVGANFGTKYLEGFQVMPNNSPLRKNEIRQAQEILTFDFLVQNGDRTFTKPNMFSNGAIIVPFDHELSFTFTNLLFPLTKPWIIQDKGRDKHWVDNMVLKKKLKKTILDVTRLSKKINKFDSSFWKQAENIIPHDWLKHDQNLVGCFNKIKTHIDSIQSNSKIFFQEIQRLLA